MLVAAWFDQWFDRRAAMRKCEQIKKVVAILLAGPAKNDGEMTKMMIPSTRFARELSIATVRTWPVLNARVS